MKIEYEKPWYLKVNPGEEQTNLILKKEYTISLSFRVGRYFARDEKIGFFGVPGKNFGVSYDYEVDLFVADISPTHVCILNKFNVVDYHLLIITRAFESQENLLSEISIYICRNSRKNQII